MKRHPLGETDLPVTPLGIGLAALGRPGYINLGHADDLNRNYAIEAMEHHAHTVLDAAWEGGIQYFDVARSYGRGEAFLGNWLRKRGRSTGETTVGSKWGYTYTADWQVDADVHEVKEHSLDVLNRQWTESLGHLGAYLDLYQVHSATLSSGILEATDVHRRLAALKEEGDVAIGLSLSGERQAETLRQAMTIEVDGVRLFDSVQATWNLLERSSGAALQEAHEAGMGVIIKEALANGRLTPRNDNPGFAAPRTHLEREAARLDTSLDALALAAVLARPWVDVVLSGAATVEHVRSNLGALDVAWDDEAEARLADLAEPPEAYWATRDALPWN
jgi:aryl-alcohol dehydrogenase-like predicted oxidoreductase